jgi:predicted MPP superfamily phosphohydrolase
MEISDNSVENVTNEFYKLKNKYETEINLNKKKIINNHNLSSKEKRSEFKNLKPKCVNCKRPGGTIFSIKYYPENLLKEQYKDEYRELKAVCGVVADPCNLNISLQIGKCQLLPDILKEIEKEIKDYKNEIIDTKNKLLFGYITTETAVQEFDDIKDYVSHFTSLLENYIKVYFDIVDNSEKKRELNEDIEKSYDFIRQIKECIVNFNQTDNNQYVRDAVNIYSTSVKPLFEKINKLKYKENTVFYNEDTNTYHLIQNKYSIKSLEYCGDSKVIKYDVGLKVMKAKKNIIIESDSEDEIVKPVEEPLEVVTGLPTIENDTVKWNTTEYQNFWDKFPPKLQTALESNTDWMSDFVNNCFTARKNGKACSFISPKDLILPPKKLSDDEYDFGNKIYNDYFKIQPPSYKETLLKLYSEKDGVRNYTMLENTLNSNLAKTLNFNNGFI